MTLCGFYRDNSHNCELPISPISAFVDTILASQEEERGQTEGSECVQEYRVAVRSVWQIQIFLCQGGW